MNQISKKRAGAVRSLAVLCGVFVIGGVHAPSQAQGMFTENPAARTCEVAFKDNSVESKPCMGVLPIPTCSNPTAKIPVSIKMIDEFGLAHVKRFDEPPAPDCVSADIPLPPGFGASGTMADGGKCVDMSEPPGRYSFYDQGTLAYYESYDAPPQNGGWSPQFPQWNYSLPSDYKFQLRNYTYRESNPAKWEYDTQYFWTCRHVVLKSQSCSDPLPATQPCNTAYSKTASSFSYVMGSGLQQASGFWAAMKTQILTNTVTMKRLP
jgi:hypothetical protein